MKMILTSALGGSRKVDGRRVPAVLLNDNGQLGKLKALWKETNIYIRAKEFFCRLWTDHCKSYIYIEIMVYY